MPKSSLLLPTIVLLPILLGTAPLVQSFPFGLFSSFSSFDPRPISQMAFKGKMGTANNKLSPNMPLPTSSPGVEEPIIEIDDLEEDVPESQPKLTSICTILLRSGLFERHAVSDEEKWHFCGRHCARRPECFFTALPCQCPCSCKPILEEEEMTRAAEEESNLN